MNSNQSQSQVPLMLTVPKEVRDILRTLAAKQNLENPDRVTSAAQIGKEIICTYLEGLKLEGKKI
ncbi:MAG: hypothetical protein AB1629_08525 [Candidatus Omnitrophota bacterium]